MPNMKENIDLNNLPRHVAIIMDGNGRWAKRKGAMRVYGHRNAVEAVRDVTEMSAELGINYLTLYAFSTENWGRPKFEVDALMQLLVTTINNELDTLIKNNVRLNHVGDLSGLPNSCGEKLLEAIDITKENKGLTLTLALNYSGRWEITEVMRYAAHLVQKGKLHPEDIDNDFISRHLNTHNIPDPELLIRTSGEMRISNFLLWQIAYTELFFTDTLWPDFRREHLHEAIISYQKRERRFGKISEQAKS
jgi:undecaprenyl diphosphate synthase